MRGIDFNPEKDIYRKTMRGNVAKISAINNGYRIAVYDIPFIHGTLYCIDLPDDKIIFLKDLPFTDEKTSLVDYAFEIDTIIFEN